MQGLRLIFCSRFSLFSHFLRRFIFNGGVHHFKSTDSLNFYIFSRRRHFNRLLWCGDHMGEKITESVEYNKRRAEGRHDEKVQKDIQLKLRKLNPINTISYVQILGTGMDTQDTSPSVLLFFDKQRFIFNAGEGLQRFCTEHKIKLSKIDHVFLSRVCSETAGGIPGLLLTLAGIGEIGMTVNIWGPSDLNYLVEAMKYFIPRASMVHTHCFGSSGVVSSTGGDGFKQPTVLVDDEVVKISAVLLAPYFPEGVDKSGMKAGYVSVVYVCELPEIKGKFDPKKAKKLGLEPGPKYRELQLGNSVMSDDQNIMVKPGDVMDGSIPGPIVILVDCPTILHMNQLLSTQSLNTYYHEKHVNCMIHLTPSSIYSSPAYLNWLTRFPDAHHIMAGRQIGNGEVPILKSSARVATRLNFLCPQFFPKLQSPCLSRRTCEEELGSEILGKRVPAKNLLKYVLRPYARLGLDGSCVPEIVLPSTVIDELKSEIPGIEEAAGEVCRLWADHGPNGSNMGTVPGCLEDVRRDDMEIVLLGTGSSQPSKYRNVTSIYVDLFSGGSLLLDCGEGTLGQLNRRFGAAGADEAVKKLRIIWISHIHADHHTGLARVLSHRSKILDGSNHGPILVIGPVQLKGFLEAYDRLEDLNMLFLDSNETLGGRHVDLEERLHGSGVEGLTSFPVLHCPHAFGVVVKGSERVNRVGKIIPGWTFVYSGDTRPCPELVEAARGATLLVHEATFEEGMEEEAVLKNHSTTKEALDVGARAGAYRVLLTHFSQRYPKIPVFGGAHMDTACVGFDFMSINLADLPRLPDLLPYLALLFPDGAHTD